MHSHDATDMFNNLFTVDGHRGEPMAFDPDRTGRLVLAGKWYSSYSEEVGSNWAPSGDSEVTVNVWLPGDEVAIRHELDGKKYPTKVDAQKALYEAGVLMYMFPKEA